MALKDYLLPEFDQEMASTRRVLERAPEDKWEWKPDPKSFALGTLATHVANLPSWIKMTLEQDSFDVAPVGGKPVRTTPAENVAGLLEIFDANIVEARRALESMTEERFAETWALLAGGHEVFRHPKSAVVRSFAFNHIVHHRAQLTVYYRLCGVPVPAIYGPSADEG